MDETDGPRYSTRQLKVRNKGKKTIESSEILHMLKISVHSGRHSGVSGEWVTESTISSGSGRVTALSQACSLTQFF